MKFKLSLLLLSLSAVISFASQVKANQNPLVSTQLKQVNKVNATSTSCTSTSTGGVVCRSTSSNQSVTKPPQNENNRKPV